ncbi:unnamed protein product [Choristocarpus tenellus]
MSVYDMIGADVETAGLWDPLGFSTDEPSLFRRRAVELKHGRVSMLAVVGVIVQSFVHLPHPLFSNPLPLAAFIDIWKEAAPAVMLVLVLIGVLELTVGKQDYVDMAPGELGGFGSIAKPVDFREWDKVQLAELKHGRLAMIAILGMLVQEQVTGEGPVEQVIKGHVRSSFPCLP